MSRKILDMRDIRCPKCEDLIGSGSAFDEKTGALKNGMKDGGTSINHCFECEIGFITRLEIVPFYFTEEIKK